MAEENPSPSQSTPPVPDAVKVAPPEAIQAGTAAAKAAPQPQATAEKVKQEMAEALKEEAPPQRRSGMNPLLAMVCGVAVGVVLPALVWKDAFKTPQGWMLGGICVLLGLLASLVLVFGIEED